MFNASVDINCNQSGKVMKSPSPSYRKGTIISEIYQNIIEIFPFLLTESPNSFSTGLISALGLSTTTTLSKKIRMTPRVDWWDQYSAMSQWTHIVTIFLHLWDSEGPSNLLRHLSKSNVRAITKCCDSNTAAKNNRAGNNLHFLAWM